ncbi:hypothetical protein M404DRAFT_718213 [Pisolithus tinctorius Marx 270]|uniref:Uncharacterized protein n=1 Tax=Pisolithus tinctorius Marx 270 TaxID=870435 RepID=A0A0C3JX15_PISTI|nr:hypothetical protein M404DRAFT_718213 [Pisolithus tinctorius Marx 270]
MHRTSFSCNADVKLSMLRDIQLRLWSSSSTSSGHQTRSCWRARKLQIGLQILPKIVV